ALCFSPLSIFRLFFPGSYVPLSGGLDASGEFHLELSVLWHVHKLSTRIPPISTAHQLKLREAIDKGSAYTGFLEPWWRRDYDARCLPQRSSQRIGSHIPGYRGR